MTLKVVTIKKICVFGCIEPIKLIKTMKQWVWTLETFPTIYLLLITYYVSCNFLGAEIIPINKAGRVLS